MKNPPKKILLSPNRSAFRYEICKQEKTATAFMLISQSVVQHDNTTKSSQKSNCR